MYPTLVWFPELPNHLRFNSSSYAILKIKYNLDLISAKSFVAVICNWGMDVPSPEVLSEEAYLSN